MACTAAGLSLIMKNLQMGITVEESSAFDLLEGGFENIAQHINLLPVDRQCRGENDIGPGGAHHGTTLIGFTRYGIDLLGAARKAGLGLFVSNHFDADHESHTAHIADQAGTLSQCSKTLQQMIALYACIADDVFTFKNIECGER